MSEWEPTEILAINSFFIGLTVGVAIMAAIFTITCWHHHSEAEIIRNGSGYYNSETGEFEWSSKG